MDFSGMTRIDCYRKIKKIFEQRGIGEENRLSGLIIAGAIGLDIHDIFLYQDKLIIKKEARKIKSYVKKILKGMPLQYAMKKAHFMGCAFYVDNAVLIPRKETEILAEEALKYIAEGKKRVLDLCTGSGCIAVSVAKLCGDAEVFASDKYPGALKVAKKNAKTNGLKGKIKFVKSDMFNNIKGKFDIIIINPPYVSEKEYDALDATIRDYEPAQALLAGDGLLYYRIIAKDAKKHLSKDGRLLLEIGCKQAEAVTGLLMENGFTDISCIKDYGGMDRIIAAKV